MINSTQDFKNFINDSNIKRIFILCGKKSFKTSGAETFLKKIISNKETKILFKSSEIPIYEELVKIILSIRNFKPDLLLAIGGGTVIDYAKIANIVDVKKNLKDLIKNYSYPFKKKYAKLLCIPTTDQVRK